jgi:hypothetical protein
MPSHHPPRSGLDLARAVRHGARAAWSLQRQQSSQHNPEGRVRPRRNCTAQPVRGLPCPTPQPGNQSDPPGCVAARSQRHAAPPFVRVDNDLRQARHRGLALDRAALASRRKCAMSRLREELDRYLSIRRSLGWDLRTTERVLWRFIAFAESQSAEHISTNLFLRWQQSFGRASRQTWAARLGSAPRHGPTVRAVAARPRCST